MKTQDSRANRQRCFASKTRQIMIDILHPITGCTMCYNKNLTDCRKEYPDAEEMSVDEFCNWKAAQQRTPIAWSPTTEEKFNEMLCILPPAAMIKGGFLVGEPMDHDAGNGQPRFEAYKQHSGVYEVANRPMTYAEFQSEMAK